MEQLINIDVNKIEEHPNNPRKDLGDLTELTESHRQNGIMQNLTVVKKRRGQVYGGNWPQKTCRSKGSRT